MGAFQGSLDPPRANDTESFLELLRSLPAPPTILAEIGACDGHDAGLMKQAFPASRVLAIEGLRENYEQYLVTRTDIEGHHAVIGQNSGMRQFFVKTVNGLHGLYDRGVAGHSVRLVEVVSLDDWCDAHGVDHIDAMKIDVEGASWDVLAGGVRVLSTLQALHVETEDWPFFQGQKLSNDVHALLHALGLQMVGARAARIGAGCQYDEMWRRSG